MPTALLLKHEHLMEAFVQHFNWRMQLSGYDNPYPAREVKEVLLSLKKSNRLGRIRIHANESKKEERGLLG